MAKRSSRVGAEHPIARKFAPLLRQIAEGATPGPAQPAPHAGLAAQLSAGVAALEAGDAQRAIDLLAPVARIFLAQLLAATHRRDEAANELRRALALAEQLGDQDAAAQVRVLLQGLG